jgi:hypothetical protein
MMTRLGWSSSPEKDLMLSAVEETKAYEDMEAM